MTPVDRSDELNTTLRVRDFASSDMFARLFREGMDLVEETASYLDGPGREDAKRLGRTGALAYASESMALTTQLMQCASWLLTQRAVAEGDMEAQEATEQRYRITPSTLKSPEWPANEDPCPPRLGDLAVRARALHDRLARLDTSLFEGDGPAPEDNPVANQLDRLTQAFGR